MAAAVASTPRGLRLRATDLQLVTQAAEVGVRPLGIAEASRTAVQLDRPIIHAPRHLNFAPGRVKI